MTTPTADTPATITTAKGGITGTLREVCEWQAEHQGSYARLQVAGVGVDLYRVDFDPEDIDATVAAVLAVVPLDDPEDRILEVYRSALDANKAAYKRDIYKIGSIAASETLDTANADARIKRDEALAALATAE